MKFGGIGTRAAPAPQWRARSLALGGLVLAWAAFCQTPAARCADYFKGKTLRIVVGSASGGGYDAYARLVGRHLGDFLPGRPNVIIENMPGASGVKAANYLYTVAPRDGTVIATFNTSMPLYEKLGKLGIHFKADRFAWIGSLSQTVDVLALWHTAGIRTIAQAKLHAVILGADTGGGTKSAYPLLLDATLGTRFKIVTGYAGSSAIALAMERGEVQGDGANPWSSWKTTHPDWVRNHLIVPLVQIGLKKDVDLADVPLLLDLASTDEERLMFRFVSAPVAIERPFAGPPGMATQVRYTLRAAFTRMVSDPDFAADAKKSDMDLDPQTGEDVEKVIGDIIGTPDAVVEKVEADTTLSAAGSQSAPKIH